MTFGQLLIWRTRAFIQYFIASKSKWRIHSPFMFDFYRQVISPKPLAIGEKIEKVRQEWSVSQEYMTIHDFGAGYNQDQQKQRRIPLAKVVQSSARTRASGELLWRLIRFFQPQEVLELGGNIGFSGLYIADALQTTQGKLTSVEGDIQLCQKARALHHFFCFSTSYVHQLFTPFLSENADKRYDLILLDGHHEAQATQNYVRLCLSLLNPGGLIIVDDIRWSPDMYQAWQTIRENPDFQVTAETFQMGFIWPHRAQAYEHFTLWSTLLN